MSKAVASNWARSAAVAVLACLLAGVWGCREGGGAAKSDVAELERVFGLKAGAASLAGDSPAAVASRAVADLKAQNWASALDNLDWMRSYAKLSPDQGRAVRNAFGNVSVRVNELDAKGDSEAKAALARAKRRADQR